ncbi:tandem-95 repeat protein [Desulfococcaceae bacterium HSG8]|nr:tandem-95 repeat protein [Desulfococcaceae bacterium HSG8]
MEKQICTRKSEKKRNRNQKAGFRVALIITVTALWVMISAGAVFAQLLTFVEMQQDGPFGADGLGGAISVAVSPDGIYVYAAGYSDNAVAVFSRNASTGELTYMGKEKDGSGSVDGLWGATSVTVSPDGSHVYVTGLFDNSVAVFRRWFTGSRLNYIETHKDGENSVDGLSQAMSVTVSPDGKNIYAAGYNDDAIAVFSRNAGTGRLTYVEVQKNGSGGVNGLNGASSVTVSPDNKHVYAAGEGDSAVAVFSRNETTGELTYIEKQSNGFGGVDGLLRARSVTVSPDGKNVYAAGEGDGAVAVFSRNETTGELTYVEMQKDGVNGVDGLWGAWSVTVSLDGSYVYAAGYNDDAIAVFSRNAGTGELIYVEMQRDGFDGVDGLRNPRSVTVSPDGSSIYAAGYNDNAVAVFALSPQVAPVAAADSYSTNEDAPLTVPAAGVLENDTDADGDPLTAIKVSDPAHGSVSLSGNGSFTYTPAAGYYGGDSFTYKANDGTDDSNVVTVSLSVTPVNDPPVITAQAAPLETPEDTAVTLAASHVTVTDPDSTVFSLSAAEGSNYTFSGNTVTPSLNFTGTLTVPVTVSDGTNTSDPWNLSVTVTPVNDVPVITGQADLSTAEDTALTLAASHLVINDPDSSAFTLTVQAGANHTVSESTVTPAPDFSGTLTVPVKVNDGAADSGIYNVSITVTAVDDPPLVINPADDVTADEDAAPATVNLGSVFTDPDDPVIEKSVTSNSNPSLVSATVEGDILTLEYQEDHNGTAEIVIQGMANGQSAEDTLTVTVNPVDDAPVVAAPLPDITANEADPDTTVSLGGVFTDVDNEDSDIIINAASSDTSLVIAAISGSSLMLAFRPGSTGTGAVTVTAWSGGKKVTDEFQVAVGRRAFTLSGRIIYYRNDKPVPGIPVTLEGTDIYTGQPFTETVHTDENGEYSFPDVSPGDHTLAPSESAPASVRPSATDASQIARHAAGSYELDEHQKLAADVTGNGTISGTDASFVARCAAGVIPAVNELGTAWKFDPPLLEVSPDTDLENQDFTGVMIGDVSGNYGGGGTGKSYHNPGNAAEIIAYRGDVLSVPVVLDDEIFLEGADIAAAFDKDVLAPQEVSLADGIPGDSGYQSVANITEEEIFLAIFASEEPSPVSGTLVFLNFIVTGTPGSRSSVTLTRFDCNEIPAGPEYRESRESASLTGGFYINGAVSRDISVRVRTGYDLARHDLNGDGKIGMKDAFYGLKQGDVEVVIRALQCAAGIE